MFLGLEDVLCKFHLLLVQRVQAHLRRTRFQVVESGGGGQEVRRWMGSFPKLVDLQMARWPPT